MKYLSQFLILAGFSLLGEALQALLPLPIPAAVWGIALLFLALCCKLVRLEQVKDAGMFLSSILSVLFVPPMAGLLQSWPLLQGALVPILVLVLGSTALILIISGKTAQAFLAKEEPHG